MKCYPTEPLDEWINKWECTELLDNLSVRDSFIVADCIEKTARFCVRDEPKNDEDFGWCILHLVRRLYDYNKIILDYDLAREIYNEIRPKFIEMIDSSYCWIDSEFEFMSMFADMYVNKKETK